MKIRPVHSVRRSSRLCSLIVLAAVSMSAAISLAQDTVYTLTITDRSPVAGSATPTESFILTAPLTSPTAVLILLPGGSGEIQLTPSGSDGTLDINSSNFLVRSRWTFAANNFYVITLDAATDFYLLTNGLVDEQGSPQHVLDVLQVITWARTTYPGLPVWLVGTSRGTAGAFVAAAYSPSAGGPNGLVFTDPVNILGDADSLQPGTSAPFPLNLAAITVPTLIVQNLSQACQVSQTSQNAVVKSDLTSAPIASVLSVAGGLPALDSNPCHALTYHGFFGIEVPTVELISLWIKVF